MYSLTAVIWLSACGLLLEQRTTWGKALSAPLVTMALALISANCGIVPLVSPIYRITNEYLVPLAVPLLLFDSDLRKVWKDTGKLLPAFGVGAFATLIGTVVAILLLPHIPATVATALCARHIGGAINFVAVAETVGLEGSLVSAAIAADNMVVALYFAILFGLGKSEHKDKVKEMDQTLSLATKESEQSITLTTMALSAAASSGLVLVGKWLTKLILPTGTSSLPLISLLTVVVATIFRSIQRLSSTGTAIGIGLIQMFFAASGASGSVWMVLREAPSLFIFSLVQISVHFGVLMGLGRGLMGLPRKELLLASNANVGGPTTAAAMATAKGWQSLILPALLVGMLGYATATGLALAVLPVLQRLVVQ